MRQRPRGHKEFLAGIFITFQPFAPARIRSLPGPHDGSSWNPADTRQVRAQVGPVFGPRRNAVFVVQKLEQKLVQKFPLTENCECGLMAACHSDQNNPNMKPSFKLLALTLAICGLMTQPASALLTIDTVSVGDAGNANDTTGYGGVNYAYSIGTYEVTISQYATFLNAVAKADPYGLYNPSMGADLNIAGISRSGLSGNYTYAAVNGGNRPITYVSWFDAARFVNWLQNGQPTGAQGAGTTETGTYALNGALSGVGFTHDPNAIYGLPTENEWYKAAYYDPSLNSGSGGYWLYPTRNNAIPNSRNGSASDPNSANFFRDDGIANGYNGGYAVNNSVTAPSGSAITTVGAFNLAASAYGTFDQGGNVWEWNDAVIGSARGLRGGSWSGNESVMRATSRSSFSPANESSIVGFRIDIIPEPGAVGMMTFGIVILAWKRKRAR
jgi:sulfatase modifying factor 1